MGRGELWTESDPLDPDTDDDACLTAGKRSTTSIRSTMARSVTRPADRARHHEHAERRGGDPDGDSIPNLSELISGTNPRWADGGPPPPQGAITIGTGSYVVVGGVVNRNEFTDWTYEDLLALDNYDTYEQGSGGDVYYRPWATDHL